MALLHDAKANVKRGELKILTSDLDKHHPMGHFIKEGNCKIDIPIIIKTMVQKSSVD